MRFTVAICTYKRAEMLAVALTSLAECVPPAAVWDVLVVDNAGEEAVARLVASFADRLPLRHVVEHTTGASHARNRAVRECEAAGSPIVLFTDDDVTFAPQWLTCMAAAQQDHPECDFWGGRVEPVWSETGPPRWFDPRLCPMLGDLIVQYRRGEEPRYWDPAADPPFYTANLALRVARVGQVGYFDTTVGHRGSIRMGMEDSLMVKALSDRGGRGWYAANAVVYHPVPAERLRRVYARRFAWRQGWLSVRLAREANGGRVPRWWWRHAAEQVLGGLRQILMGTWRVDIARRFAGQLGATFGMSKLVHAARSGPPDPHKAHE